MIRTALSDGIGTLTLDRPPLNILSRAMLTELRGGLAEMADSKDVRVLLLTANGEHFSAGADVGEHLPPECDEMLPEFLDTIRAIDSFPLPVIAAVHGRCLGGGFELVQAADVIVAGESALFGQPEIVLGVSAPAACAMLPIRVSPSLAAEILLTGDPITADRARQAGLVGLVVEDDAVESSARALGQRMARHSGAALRLTKKSMRVGSATALEATLAESGRIYTDELMQTEDAVEGLQSFLDKRTPEWTGR